MTRGAGERRPDRFEAEVHHPGDRGRDGVGEHVRRPHEARAISVGEHLRRRVVVREAERTFDDRVRDPPVLVAGDVVAWVVGHAVGEPYRATGVEPTVLCCTVMRDA